jgi:hypothetical protein
MRSHCVSADRLGRGVGEGVQLLRRTGACKAQENADCYSHVSVSGENSTRADAQSQWRLVRLFKPQAWGDVHFIRIVGKTMNVVGSVFVDVLGRMTG